MIDPKGNWARAIKSGGSVVVAMAGRLPACLPACLPAGWLALEQPHGTARVVAVSLLVTVPELC